MWGINIQFKSKLSLIFCPLRFHCNVLSRKLIEKEIEKILEFERERIAGNSKDIHVVLMITMILSYSSMIFSYELMIYV